MDYSKIRGAAMAYYANLSEEERIKAWKFFQSMDTDGNGTISRSEYLSALGKKGYTSTQSEFEMLDKDGDGVLEFEECITLYYKIAVHNGSLVCSDGCGIELKPTATSASQVQPTATSASQVTTSKKSSKSEKVKKAIEIGTIGVNAVNAAHNICKAATIVSEAAKHADDCTIM